MTLEVGKPAPDFTLNDQHEQPRSLSEFRGKDLIIYFYPKDNTPGCTKQARTFTQLWNDMQAAGAVVLGISPDGAKSHARFIEKYNIPFDLLSDPDKSMMTKYGAYGEKVLYGVKRLGIIRSTVWIGPDGTVVKHWKKVSAMSNHPEQVLKLLGNKA